MSKLPNMSLIIEEDIGFTIDTGHDLQVHLNREEIIFSAKSEKWKLSFPVDDVMDLIAQLETAYQLLIRRRRGILHIEAEARAQAAEARASVAIDRMKELEAQS